MINKRDNMIDDEALLKVNGGTLLDSASGDDSSLRRAKCECGEIFMANLNAPTIICPGCQQDIKRKLLASAAGGAQLTGSANPAGMKAVTGVNARMS
jgi:hypothetical protein